MNGLRTIQQKKQYTLKDGTVKEYESNVTYFVKNIDKKRIRLIHTQHQIEQIIDAYNTLKYPSFINVFNEIIKNYDFDITYNYIVKYINEYKKTLI